MRNVFSQAAPRLRLTYGCSTFVPKAHTPFQWYGLRKEGDKRLSALQKGLRPMGVDFRPESYKWSVVQAMLSRGDRRLVDVLISARDYGDSLGSFRRAFNDHKCAPCTIHDARRCMSLDECMNAEPLTGEPYHGGVGGERAAEATCRRWITTCIAICSRGTGRCRGSTCRGRCRRARSWCTTRRRLRSWPRASVATSNSTFVPSTLIRTRLSLGHMLLQALTPASHTPQTGIGREGLEASVFQILVGMTVQCRAHDSHADAVKHHYRRDAAHRCRFDARSVVVEDQHRRV